MFYTYTQNNSGGHMDVDLRAGISHYVVIEAPNARTADALAVGIGLYFDGCSTGMDCSCCGDRWNEKNNGWSDKGDEVPSIWGAPIEGGSVSKYHSDPDVPEGFIHYLDGRVEAFFVRCRPYEQGTPEIVAWKDGAPDTSGEVTYTVERVFPREIEGGK